MNREKENVTWLTNMSGDAYVDIVNMAVETSLQHMTTLTVSHCLLIYFAQAEEGKSIYLRSGKSEADDSFEVYHINRLKEIIGDAFQKLAKGINVLRSCANAFTVPNQTT